MNIPELSDEGKLLLALKKISGCALDFLKYPMSYIVFIIDVKIEDFGLQ